MGEVEDQIAVLAGVEARQALAYNSGMAATVGAIDVALYESGVEAPVVAFATELYTQSQRYIAKYLRQRGVKAYPFDSGDPAAVERTLQLRQPNVVVSETVSNYLNVPVLDNTLPLSTGLPIGEQIDEVDKVIVVESGTKSYSFNEELLGVVYTKHPGLLNALRRHRRVTGAVVGTASLERILALLPESRETFDERNRQLFQNTGALAIALYTAIERQKEENNREGIEQDLDITISHPALPSHDNHELY